MKTTEFRIMLRFAGTFLCHLALFIVYRRLGRTAPPMTQVSIYLTAGISALVALGLMIPVVIRGRPTEKVAAIVLCLLPLMILAGLVWQSIGPRF